MEKIYKNNKEYLRFKIGDEFDIVSGKGSFNKMKVKNLASDSYSEENGFIYPVYDGSTSGDHIKGYASLYNFDGKAIKVSKDGVSAGDSRYVTGKTYNAGHSFYLISNNFSNEYMALLFSRILPSFQQGTGIPSVKFETFKNKVLEVPQNHNEIAHVIKRINQYKQLSKQLSKQQKDYKLSILQAADRAVGNLKSFEMTNALKFKISDEFIAESSRLLYSRNNLKEVFDGDITFNKMLEAGIVSNTRNKVFKYPFMDSSTQNNHIKGYSRISNFKGKAIKVSESGDAGKSIYIKGEYFIGRPAYLLINDVLVNEYTALFFNRYLPQFKQTSVLSNLMFGYVSENEIIIPTNHQELALVIKKINEWEKLINETTKKMNMYIDGILKYTIKGETNE